jgi:hypothetical protein
LVQGPGVHKNPRKKATRKRCFIHPRRRWRTNGGRGMRLRFLGKDICETRFNLIIHDTLDYCVESEERHTEDNARALAESLIEDITSIIYVATDEWIEENVEVTND